MKILTFKQQSRIYKCVVEIIKVLATIGTEEATDAICDVYTIAAITGNKQMIKLLRGASRIKPVTAATLSKWSKEEVLSYIKLLEEIVDGEADK